MFFNLGRAKHPTKIKEGEKETLSKLDGPKAHANRKLLTAVHVTAGSPPTTLTSANLPVVFSKDGFCSVDSPELT